MGKINSKKKGARGELEFSHVCEKYGFNKVYRTAQTNGKLEQSEADCVGLPGIHIEVKRVESLNIYNAIDQAVRDASVKTDVKLPIVFHRKNHKPWLATSTLDTWMKLYKSWLKDEDREI